MGICESKREIIKIREENDLLKKKLKDLHPISQIPQIPPLNFYDIIVYIQSLIDINKGWKVEYNPKFFEKYEEFAKVKVLKIGVIGNSNKGKSFILSKLSYFNLPSGTSLKTQGLSIKYPEFERYPNKRIVLLDSAGLETPVLLEKQEKEKKNDLFKEKSRDKIITELFLQNYIIQYSDILIFVVGILSYSEQKLLNRIKMELRRANKNTTLYVIHNLMNYYTKKQVKDYIEEICLKSATFNLEKQIIINFNENPKEEGICFYEKNTAKNFKPVIKHLFFANEGSEAGKCYNKFTLEYLVKSFEGVPNLEPFDAIKTIKESFKKASKEILENIEGDIEFDDSNKNIIKLKNPKSITLKRFGFQNLRANGYEPSYDCYKNGNEIIIRIEVPGHCQLNSPKLLPLGEYTFIRISGEKYKDEESGKNGTCLFSSREAGEFSLDIPFRHEEFLFKDKPPEIIEDKSIFIIKYELEN